VAGNYRPEKLNSSVVGTIVGSILGGLPAVRPRQNREVHRERENRMTLRRVGVDLPGRMLQATLLPSVTPTPAELPKAKSLCDTDRRVPATLGAPRVGLRISSPHFPPEFFRKRSYYVHRRYFHEI